MKAKENKHLSMYVLDFSREGLKLLIPQTISFSNSLVMLHVYLPNKHTPVYIEGQIKWMRPVENYIEVGVKIDNLNPMDKSEILEYGYKRWSVRE